MARILIIDDDEQSLALFEEILLREGHEVVTAHNGIEAEHHFRDGGADVVVTDILMPERDGIETIIDLRRQNPQVKIIAVSGGGRLGPTGYLETAAILGASRTFTKPVDRHDLVAAVGELIAA